MTDDLTLLKDAVLEAGKLALDIRARGLKVMHKAGGSPVTNGDLKADALLKERLRTARPDYGWLSEETPDDPARLSKSRVFVVDPIDGTTSYAKGRDFWSVCAGVVEDGRAIAGAVFAPSLRELYEASLGQGSRLNGAPIHVSGQSGIEGASMLGDAKMFAHPSWPTPWPTMRIEQRNSIAYRMALVAAGVFDACLAPSTKHDWDLAAADIIVAEAGGLATDHRGRPFRYNQAVPRQVALVCAGPALHPLLLKRLDHVRLGEERAREAK